MSVKRTGTGSSSSHQATQVAGKTAAAVSPMMVTKADATGEPSEAKVLTIDYPVSVGETDPMKIGGFLERCHYCKKRIPQNSEVFMYSNLCAFCSAECRDLQIELDNFKKKQPENPKDNVVPGNGICSVKARLGS